MGFERLYFYHKFYRWFFGGRRAYSMMAQRLVEKHGHCNDCDCDFTFVKGNPIHDNHDHIVTNEFYKEVPDHLADEVTDY